MRNKYILNKWMTLNTIAVAYREELENSITGLAENLEKLKKAENQTRSGTIHHMSFFLDLGFSCFETELIKVP